MRFFVFLCWTLFQEHGLVIFSCPSPQSILMHGLIYNVVMVIIIAALPVLAPLVVLILLSLLSSILFSLLFPPLFWFASPVSLSYVVLCSLHPPGPGLNSLVLGDKILLEDIRCPFLEKLHHSCVLWTSLPLLIWEIILLLSILTEWCTWCRNLFEGSCAALGAGIRAGLGAALGAGLGAGLRAGL